METGADLGIAHDGDADRCLAVDAQGNFIDGDHLMAIVAVSMKKRGLLTHDTLVATVMSNLGLELAMEANGITLVRTAVGDRYVLDAMESTGFILGGEQSGHIIFRQFSTTGDGIMTGLHVAAEMARSGKTLAELATVMTALPQTLVNVTNVNHVGLDSDQPIADLVAQLEPLLAELCVLHGIEGSS
jgi:phosphoglucosamine mutase